MKRLILLTLANCIIFNHFLFAAPAYPDNATYLDKVDEKFDRSAVNLVAGWTEVLSEPVEHYRAASSKKDKVLKTIVGFGEGIFNAAANIAGGCLNLLTSPLPAVSIPLPENGVDLKTLTGTSFEDSRITERNLDPLKQPAENFVLTKTTEKS